MILHRSEKIPETFRSAIQEALEKGLLKDGTQITKVADYRMLITFILLLQKRIKHTGRQWTRNFRTYTAWMQKTGHKKDTVLMRLITLSGWRQQETQYS